MMGLNKEAFIMPMTNPDGVIFAYAGYTFPPWIKTKVTEEPVTSGDNRTVKISKITISASGWITQTDVNDFEDVDGEPTDSFMEDLRRRLQKNGEPLQYVNKGFGTNISVNNGEGPQRDAFMGPKPGKLVWWPLGGAPDGNHAAGFEFEVTTWLPECDEFTFGDGIFLEIPFTVTYDTDEAGIVTIVHRGSWQIPLSLDNNTIDRNIEQSIPAVIANTPIGFIRKISRTLSADRTTINFTITDTQKEVPPPPDVVSIEMRHRIRQEKPYIPMWAATISGTLRMAPNAVKSLAQRRFFNIAAHRMTYARKHATIGLRAGSPGIIQGVVEMEEDLFKNEARFTVNYRILGAPLKQVMEVSGLWRDISAGSAEPWDAETWSASLWGNAQKPTGILGTTFNLANDVIINVCAGATGSQNVAGPSSQESTSDEITLQYTATDDTLMGESSWSGLIHDAGQDSDEGNDLFPPETSWIAWECVPQVQVNHHTVTHKPLGPDVTVTYAPTPVDPFDPAAVAGNETTPTPGYSTSTPDIVQQMCSPSMTVRLVGFGVRVAHRVQAPKMLFYGGVPVVLQTESVSERTMGVSDGVSMYRTDWDLTYIVPSPPSQIPLLANPTLFGDGGGALQPPGFPTGMIGP